MDLSSLRKLLGMIVAIAAMVLLAPVAASAHEGHGQRRADVFVFHAVDHAAHAGPSQMAVQAPGATQAVVAMPDISGSAEEGPCVSGCCFNMGCCGATLLVEAPRLDPPAGLPLLVPDRPTARSSARTLSLLEPPNLLA